MPEFKTTQEGIDPYICTADPDGAAGANPREKWAPDGTWTLLAAIGEDHLSAQFATPYISEVFDTMAQTLKPMHFAVEDEKKKDPEEDLATYFHVPEGDIIILDPPADSDPEADESMMLMVDPDFWGMEVEGFLLISRSFCRLTLLWALGCICIFFWVV